MALPAAVFDCVEEGAAGVDDGNRCGDPGRRRSGRLRAEGLREDDGCLGVVDLALELLGDAAAVGCRDVNSPVWTVASSRGAKRKRKNITRRARAWINEVYQKRASLYLGYAGIVTGVDYRRQWSRTMIGMMICLPSSPESMKHGGRTAVISAQPGGARVPKTGKRRRC